MHIVGKMWNLGYDGHALTQARLELLSSCMYSLELSLVNCLAWSIAICQYLKIIQIVLTVSL